MAVDFSFGVPYQQGSPVNLKFNTGPPPSSQLKGITTDLNTLYSGNSKYQPAAWTILADLGINTLDVRGGGEGDYFVRWNMNKYSDWATNFNNFLNTANSHGVRIMFSLLGDDYDLLFGIRCPELYRNGPDGLPIVGTDIATAKAMIDKLAGANSLNHNFLTDPRVVAWSPANEVYLSDSTTQSWVLQMLDYMRGKGALTFVSCTIIQGYGTGGWLESISFQATEPILHGRVDYLCYHMYEAQEAKRLQNLGYTTAQVYNSMLPYFRNYIQQYMVSGRGSTPLSNLIMGEFGLWIDGSTSMGVTGPFTETTRGGYYHAMYQACLELGIKNIFPYYCFQDNQPNYEIVATNGVYYTACTQILQQYNKI